MPIDLEPQYLRMVEEVLQQHIPDCEVRVFGSRVTGRAKKFSDLDLAIVSTAALSSRRMALLANAFEESNLPFKVDILDLAAAGPNIQTSVAQNSEVMLSGFRDADRK